MTYEHGYDHRKRKVSKVTFQQISVLLYGAIDILIVRQESVYDLAQ